MVKIFIYLNPANTEQTLVLEEHKFVEFLRRSKLKVTRARRAVLKEVYGSHKHFDAEELYLRMKDRGARVSRATVYRTLNLLVTSGLVRKLELGETRSLYEHVLGHAHHDHLICLRCGEVYEFNHPRIEEIQREICKQFDFDMQSHSQQIYGFCRDCRSKISSKA